MRNAYHEKQLFWEPHVPYSFRTYTTTVDGPHIIAYPHYHEFIELIYCKKGALELTLDDSKFILHPGDLAIIHPMSLHTTHSLESLCNQYIAILFEPNLLYNTNHSALEMRYIAPFMMRSTQNQFLFRSVEIQDTPIINLLESIVAEEQAKDYGFELAVRTHIGSIGLWLLRYWNEKGSHSKTSNNLSPQAVNRLQLVLDYVAQNYAEDISVGEMATLSNVTYSYFSRFFKKHMNRNFKEYVNLVRIRKSEDLLISTDHSITDIGHSVGFTTTSYFIKQFKLFKHMTPKKYRTLCQNQK